MRKTKPDGGSALRRGWTTGACAAAATKAAYTALLSGEFPDPVSIRLPKGEEPAFALALEGRGEGWARAGIIKDAGDDPDVTHGALIIATVRQLAGQGDVVFKAGEGVGTVTLSGLPIPPGEPAINPVPRRMMREVIAEVAADLGSDGAIEVEISVPGGKDLARKTWNPRLGIVGGLSILGTTGIVHPFSCSAWIASIHRGIDVAREAALTHIAGATGSTSEDAVREHYGLTDTALIDMGDFVGGMLKYLRAHPIERVTVAGGFGKLTKMAQGAMDLHSGRSQVDFDWLAERVGLLGGDAATAGRVRNSNSALQALEISYNCGIDLAGDIARNALDAGYRILRGSPVALDILVVDRSGAVIGHAG